MSWRLNRNIYRTFGEQLGIVGNFFLWKSLKLNKFISFGVGSKIGCLNGGLCRIDSGMCECQEPFVGDLCEETQSERDLVNMKLDEESREEFFCLNLECGDHGICKKGKCYCEEGYSNINGASSKCIKTTNILLKSGADVVSNLTETVFNHLVIIK
jgi:hypothetical protein